MKIESLQIGITDFCNLRCIHCGQNASEGYGHPGELGPEQFRNGKLGFMDYSLYEKIINDFIKDEIRFDIYNFFWFGETLLHPEFKKFFIKSFEIPFFDKFWLYSNGVFLDEGILRFMYKESKSFDRLYFSLDAGDRESFRTIKRTDDFERVVKNFKTALKIKKEKGLKKPQLVLGLIVLPENIESLEKFIDNIRSFAQDIGIGLKLVYDSPDSDEDCIYLRVAYLPEQAKFEKLYQDFLKKLGLIHKKDDDDIKIERKTNMLLIDEETLKPDVINRPACPAPFRMVTINWDGRMAACCSDYEMEINLPSLKNMNFMDAWNSKEYLELRKIHLLGDFNKIKRCDQCGGIDALPICDKDIERLGDGYNEMFEKYKKRVSDV